MDKRQIKIGIYGFVIMLLVSMLALKPFLPRALFHNFAGIYDYTFFSNRVVKAASHPTPWKISPNRIQGPDLPTRKMLEDLGTTALLVIENGEIVYERYDLDGNSDVISGSFSMAKSIVSLLTGFALQEHKIRSLDEPISNYLPEYEGRDEGKIKIRDLLTMSSGLNWNEAYSNPFSITTEAYYGTDLHQTTFKQRSVRDPGTQFEYQSGTSELLGYIVSRAVNRSLSQYASEKIWGPTGAEKDALWSLDHDEGMEKAYCCFNATARDFARIGELVRLQGKWNGVELLSPDYIRQMTAPNGIPNKEGKPTDYYGYQWWILKTPSGDIPYARGILGQYIMVVPQKNRVVVRLGKRSGEKDDHHPEEVRAIANWVLTH